MLYVVSNPGIQRKPQICPNICIKVVPMHTLSERIEKYGLSISSNRLSYQQLLQFLLCVKYDCSKIQKSKMVVTKKLSLQLPKSLPPFVNSARVMMQQQQQTCRFDYAAYAATIVVLKFCLPLSKASPLAPFDTPLISDSTPSNY